MFVEKSAEISADQVYRYLLSRTWKRDGKVMTFIMLNPSTADAAIDDPTIRRCMSFAEREGFGGIRVVNLYAYRATDPHYLEFPIDAVGPRNDDTLARIFTENAVLDEPVVAAWGAGAAATRGGGGAARIGRVLELLQGYPLLCLGLTNAGQPRHPLYVRGDAPLIPYPGEPT
ncbi:hypothetical protein AS850_02940 [Frondihabitans sp. 762G35]|uniref:DUF1643 domain-containing protein n=1 Tax=Frondihabitans sp. 762G35 TaxID=1446794 RepID=UPI000D207DA6|nr:DUF1643 domain-containing protein [Frondihabitans sp. 762G35]ARC56029.1 hypothetical protein AS850_02940 [Frondihabitans sp. 762G35]